jgi:hypothetical protein
VAALTLVSTPEFAARCLLSLTQAFDNTATAKMMPPGTTPIGTPLWNTRHLGVCILIALMGQMVVLPCLCAIGTAKMSFALFFDVLVGLRVWIAYRLRETGRGWMFYAALTYLSPAWIQGLAFLVLGDT